MELNFGFMLHTLYLTLAGIPTTLKITAVSLLVSTPIAFFIALAKIYNVRIAKQLATLYVSCVRGTPIILQILIVYSLLPSLINGAVKQLGLGFNVFDLNPIIYAYIVFTFNTTAGLSEVFRSALLTVNRGQLEAAYAAGMSTVQAYRRIIVPQALVVALPNICNLTVNLIKLTSLAFVMSVKDITAIAKIEASYGYNYIEAYLTIFVIYILVCSVTQLLFSLAEKHFGAYKAAMK